MCWSRTAWLIRLLSTYLCWIAEYATTVQAYATFAATITLASQAEAEVYVTCGFFKAYLANEFSCGPVFWMFLLGCVQNKKLK